MWNNERTALRFKIVVFVLLTNSQLKNAQCLPDLDFDFGSCFQSNPIDLKRQQ